MSASPASQPIAKRPARPRPVIGWREYVALPRLGVTVKAKVDTGARTSAVHATQLSVEEGDDGQQRISFTLDLGDGEGLRVTREITDERDITSSNGQVERRFVVTMAASLHDVEWPIEVSLTDRADMLFPMLLGRTALRRRFLVDPGRSFLGSDRPEDGV